MQASVSREGIVVAVAPEGKLTALNVDSFREKTMNILKTHQDLRVLIIDLSQLTFMDSSGLGTLIDLQKKSNDSGREIKLTSLRKEVRLVFEITRAYKLFDIFDSTEEALRVTE